MLREITEIIEEVVCLDGCVLTRDSIFGDDFPVDSQEMLRIVAKVQSRFGVRIDLPMLLRLRTVGSLLDVIENAAAGPQGLTDRGDEVSP